MNEKEYQKRLSAIHKQYDAIKKRVGQCSGHYSLAVLQEKNERLLRLTMEKNGATEREINEAIRNY